MKVKAIAAMMLIASYCLAAVAGVTAGLAWQGGYPWSIAVVVGVASGLVALRVPSRTGSHRQGRRGRFQQKNIVVS